VDDMKRECLVEFVQNWAVVQNYCVMEGVHLFFKTWGCTCHLVHVSHSCLW